MHKFTFLARSTFPGNIIRTVMSVDTVIIIWTCIRLLKRSTELFLAIISQCGELSFAEDVLMRILAVVFRAFEGVEIEHITRSGIKILDR
jgi:hypothetical protein